jgi:hypothetical protein
MYMSVVLDEGSDMEFNANSLPKEDQKFYDSCSVSMW